MSRPITSSTGERRALRRDRPDQPAPASMARPSSRASARCWRPVRARSFCAPPGSMRRPARISSAPCWAPRARRARCASSPTSAAARRPRPTSPTPSWPSPLASRRLAGPAMPACSTRPAPARRPGTASPPPPSRPPRATASRCRNHPITTEDWPTPARRPADSRLDCAKLARVFGIRLPEWRDSVARTVDAIMAAEASSAG